jgi:hypothetical protein
MGDIVPLPHIEMHVEAMHGYIDYGGMRFGFMALVEAGTCRCWRVVNKRATDDEIPAAVREWLGRTISGMLERMNADDGSSLQS